MSEPAAGGGPRVRPLYETSDADWLRALSSCLARVDGKLSDGTDLYAWTPTRLRQIADDVEASEAQLADLRGARDAPSAIGVADVRRRAGDPPARPNRSLTTITPYHLTL